jgi:DNA mismatch endonuclease (patch repair protein)
MDIVSKKKRSEMMSGIGSKNTKPEIIVRKLLHSNGYRFRLHSKNLPGRPDICLPKHKSVIFVNGCFWHGHSCPIFRVPKTRPDFWYAKIEGNRQRDRKNIEDLLELGWRVLVIWECTLRGKNKASFEGLSKMLDSWFDSDQASAEL